MNRSEEQARIKYDGILDLVNRYKNGGCVSNEAYEYILEISFDFKILLTTGGPAVRINYDGGQAFIEYQDYGTPWVRLDDYCDEDILFIFVEDLLGLADWKI